MISRYIFSLLISLSISTTAWGELTVTKKEAGIFSRPDKGTSLVEGERLLQQGERRERVEQTRRVPAKLGTKFGVRYSVAGKKIKGNQVKLLYLSPSIIDPFGKQHDKFEVVQELSFTAGSHLIAFEMTEKYELALGTWRLMVFEEDRLLIDESFEVVAP